MSKDGVRKCGIYMIKNLANQKIYIGSSIHIKRRIQKHKNYLRNNHHGNSSIQKDWNIYGEMFFEASIIELCDAPSLLNRETYWVSFYGTLDPNKGYNYSLPNNIKIHREPKEKNIPSRIKYFFINTLTREKIESSFIDFYKKNNFKLSIKTLRKRVSECIHYWRNKKTSRFSYQGWIVVHPLDYNPYYDYASHDGRVEYLKNLVRKPKQSQKKKPEDIIPYSDRNLKRTPITIEDVKTGVQQVYPSRANLIEFLNLVPSKVDKCLNHEFKKYKHRGYYFKKA